jgi:thioredoxin-like negative regulator of GroEL
LVDPWRTCGSDTPHLERDVAAPPALPSALAACPLFKGKAMRVTHLILAALAMTASADAEASDFRSFEPSAFAAIQKQQSPTIVFVHAAWCPICKSQEATIKKLLATPRFKNVSVLTIDFDSQKQLWQKFGASAQSTIIGFHGRRETSRLAYETDPDKIEALLASTLR